MPGLVSAGLMPKGAFVPRTTTKVLAGIAVAALAAAGVAAVVNHRRGHSPDPDARAHLDELDARLDLLIAQMTAEQHDERSQP